MAAAGKPVIEFEPVSVAALDGAIVMVDLRLHAVDVFSWALMHVIDDVA